MSSLWLVTPVLGRQAITRLCLEQRARVLHELAGLGVEAHQVIVGNDENLATAREFGFTVLERPNVLGLRINDGFEHAFRLGGADHVMFAGSDTWLLAETLADLPGQGAARSSAWLTFVNGESIASIERSPAQGWVPWTLSRELMEPLGFRPVPDDQKRLLDSAILDAINTVVHQDDAFEFHVEDDPLRAVDFRGPWAEQMTPWELLVPVGHDRPDPFGVLATRYPADLVERLERLYP